MLYHLLYPMSQDYSVFNIFRYITFRSLMAFLLATTISIIWGKRFIFFMKNKQFGQVIRDDGPQSHLKKAGTPTMGGVVIIGSILIALMICGNFLSAPIILTLFTTLSLFVLGFVDDYLKVLKKNTDGISAKAKLFWQFLIASVAVWAMVYFQVIDTKLYMPFLKESVIDLGVFLYNFRRDSYCGL